MFLYKLLMWYIPVFFFKSLIVFKQFWNFKLLKKIIFYIYMWMSKVKKMNMIEMDLFSKINKLSLSDSDDWWRRRPDSDDQWRWSTVVMSEDIKSLLEVKERNGRWGEKERELKKKKERTFDTILLVFLTCLGYRLLFFEWLAGRPVVMNLNPNLTQKINDWWSW